MKLRRQPVTPEVTLFFDVASGQPRAVSASFPRPTWRARRPAAMGQLPHAGTALLVGETWLEIVAERPDPALRGTTVYELAPWEENFVIRVAEELTPETCRAALRVYRETRQRERKGAMLRCCARSRL